METTKPQFTLTPEELELIDDSLEFYLRYLESCEDYSKEIDDAKTKAYTDRIKKVNNILNQINQYQNEHN